jgi:uncharacterized Zn-binding protein involved in type VI secretion
MPAAGRVGDQARNAEGGDPCCERPVEGPAQRGSPDVLINGRAALRVGDPGEHAPCSGKHAWKAEEGSRSVTINGVPAHRRGDVTTHCHGKGELVEGSPDVCIGDKGADEAQPIPHDRTLAIKAVDALGRLIKGVTVLAVCPHKPDYEETFDGTTTLTGWCTATRVSLRKALQIGEWDPGAHGGDVMAPAYALKEDGSKGMA